MSIIQVKKDVKEYDFEGMADLVGLTHEFPEEG